MDADVEALFVGRWAAERGQPPWTSRPTARSVDDQRRVHNDVRVGVRSWPQLHARHVRPVGVEEQAIGHGLFDDANVRQLQNPTPHDCLEQRSGRGADLQSRVAQRETAPCDVEADLWCIDDVSALTLQVVDDAGQQPGQGAQAAGE